MRLDSSLRVASIDGDHVRLRAQPSFEVLLDQCERSKCTLLKRLFDRAVNATGAHPSALVLEIGGAQPCFRVTARWKQSKLQTEAERCRGGGELSIPPEQLERLLQVSPAGSAELKRRASAAELRLQLAAAAQGLGTFRLNVEDANYLQFDLVDMKGQILRGESWWESVTVSVYLNASPDGGRLKGATLRWVASGKLAAGLGSTPPPEQAYAQDLEPEHAEPLRKFVSRLMLAGTGRGDAALVNRP